MAVSIESAYLGDEKSRVNITESIRKKITGSGIEVPVNSGLLPIVQVGGDIKLTNDEKREAQDKAQQVCGGGNDTACLEVKRQEFQRQRLAEKENEQNSTANVIKGRRLTVTLRDGARTKVVEVPEGQVFKLTKDELGTKELQGPAKSIAEKLNLSGTAIEILKVVSIIVGTGLYAFSILITYRSFVQAGYEWLTYGATAAAVFIPYSGFFIVLAFFGLREFIKNMPVKKQ